MPLTLYKRSLPSLASLFRTFGFQRLLSHLAYQSLDFERTRWR